PRPGADGSGRTGGAGRPWLRLRPASARPHRTGTAWGSPSGPTLPLKNAWPAPPAAGSPDSEGKEQDGSRGDRARRRVTGRADEHQRRQRHQQVPSKIEQAHAQMAATGAQQVLVEVFTVRLPEAFTTHDAQQ